MLDEKPFNPNANHAATAPAFLSVWNIEAFYGESYIVQDVSFNVHEGEILALLGRNGAGKTSTLRAIARMDNPELRHGEVWLDHKPLHSMTSYEAAQAGIALVPEDRRIIPGLTVEENLKLAQIAPPIGWSLERIYSLFPRLGERRTQDGVTLSGGEQQMLAIARALMTRPKMLLLDEPSFGIAPRVTQEIYELLHQLREIALLVLAQEAAVKSSVLARKLRARKSLDEAQTLVQQVIFALSEGVIPALPSDTEIPLPIGKVAT